MADIYPSLTELLEAGAHFGHVLRRRNPKMDKYVYQSRGGISIIDLVKTRENLEKASEYIEEQVASGKVIVMVGTKGQAVEVVSKRAKENGIPHVVNRWVGGTITNWDEIYGRIKDLREMRTKMEKGEYSKYTKKEQVLKKRDIERLERMYGGIAELEAVPDILFIVDPTREKTVVAEASMRGIPIVAIADTNADPDMVEYVIPANDDAVKSVELLVNSIADAVVRGYTKAKKLAPKKEPSKDTKNQA